MRKTINAQIARRYRRKLMATASAAALLGFGAGHAEAADTDRPLLWIELGGQLERVNAKDQPFVPSFTAVGAQHGLVPISGLEKLTHYSLGEEGRISFQSEDSDWIFSLSIRYGRAGQTKKTHQELPLPEFKTPYGDIHKYLQHRHDVGIHLARTADYMVASTENYAVVDFEAGKDVGLGMFGHNSTSQIHLGLRFAQFTSKTHMHLSGDPNPYLGKYKYYGPHHELVPFARYVPLYKAAPDISRSFRGLGPSLSWNGSAELLNDGTQDANVSVDWGVNAAALFGRQRARIHHHTTRNLYTTGLFLNPFHFMYSSPPVRSVDLTKDDRSRTVMVPNLGGFAGISFRYADSKVSFGYRADWFFGAMDGGTDMRKSVNRGFFGPFASISIGLGG